MSTPNSRYTYRFLFSYPSATFTLLLLCFLSAHNLTVAVLEGVFGRDMPHQEDVAPTAPNPSLPRWVIPSFMTPFAPMSRPCLILVHNCVSRICTVTDYDPSQTPPNKLNLIENSQKYIDTRLFMFFSLVLFIVLVPYIDQMQSQLLLNSNQIGWNIDPSLNSVHLLLQSEIMTQHLKIGALSWKQTDRFFIWRVYLH